MQNLFLQNHFSPFFLGSLNTEGLNLYGIY